MTLWIVTNSSTGNGPELIMGSGQDGLIIEGVTVTSLDDETVQGLGDDHILNVQGTVLSDTDHAIRLGVNEDSHGQHLIVGENGYVGTFAETGSAVRIRGHDSQVDNAGTIHGLELGLQLEGKDTSSSTTVNNSGLIEAGSYAIFRSNSPTSDEKIVINNTGEIRSGTYAYWTDHASAIDVVTNTGRIKGSIALGGGADIYDGRGGHIYSSVFGDAGSDLLIGGDFADALVGGDDADRLLGGGGDDTLFGSKGFDQIVGDDGNDRLYGGADGDLMGGGAGNDRLDGGLGGNSMNGGLGNDTYLVDDYFDIISDSGGIDVVETMVDFNLGSPAKAIGGLEVLKLMSINNISGHGNGLANTIIGGIGNNTITGAGGNNSLIGDQGNDRMWGDAGNDVVNGGIGSDRLYGGLGNDTLTGGSQADQFVFDTRPNGVTNRDVITDYQHGIDRIWLDNDVFRSLAPFGHEGPLNPTFFRLGAAAQDANDHVIYNRATGALSYDADGAGGTGAVVLAVLTGKPALNADDFQVI